MTDSKALAVTSGTSNVDLFRASTNAADMCRAIVVETAMDIQGRKYVQVEGWQAIAIAHGCTASARSVERVQGGVRAIGEIRRMSDGAVIAESDGFVGEDEPTWFGGTTKAWKWGEKRGEKVWYDKEMPKRPDYAIRAMTQTRAISRACRSAFAHVVVMMNAGLSTTPAEEVPEGGFVDADFTPVKADNKPSRGQQQAPQSAGQEHDQSEDNSEFIKTMEGLIAQRKSPQECDEFYAANNEPFKARLTPSEYKPLMAKLKAKRDSFAAPETNPFEDAA